MKDGNRVQGEPSAIPFPLGLSGPTWTLPVVSEAKSMLAYTVTNIFVYIYIFVTLYTLLDIHTHLHIWFYIEND